MLEQAVKKNEFSKRLDWDKIRRNITEQELIKIVKHPVFILVEGRP